MYLTKAWKIVNFLISNWQVFYSVGLSYMFIPCYGTFNDVSKVIEILGRSFHVQNPYFAL